MKTALFALALLATSVHAQTYSTLCQAVEVPIDSLVADRRLIGCGEGFSQNLLWHLDRSDSVDGTLNQKWTRGVTGRGAVIYILDYGVRRSHQEFVRPTGSNVIAGIDVAMQGRDNLFDNCEEPAVEPCPSGGAGYLIVTHGTAVASVAAGARAGVAPGASIVAVRMAGDEDVWLDGLQQVIEHAYAPTTPQFHTGIISISQGVDNTAVNAPVRLKAMMEKMIAGVDVNGNPDPNGKRFLFVVAAGNCGSGPIVSYPAPYGTLDGVITVGAITRQNTVWSGSCRIDAVDLLAPGEEMLVASLTGIDHYRYKPDAVRSGTSYATPYVAGMAARLLELKPTLTPVELEAKLKESPSRVGPFAVPVMLPAVRRRAATH